MPVVTLPRPAARVALRLLLAGACVAGGALAAAGDQDAARRALRAQGLVWVNSLWLHADEVELRRRLDSLDRLERRYHSAQTDVDAAIADNDAAHARLMEAEAQHRRTLDSLKDPLVTGSDRKSLEENARRQADQVKELKRQFRDEEQLGDHPPVRQRVIRLIAARTELEVTAAEIRRLAAELPPRYERLRADAEVADALAALVPRARLGPARDYQQELRRLASVDRIVRSNVLPVYRQQGRYRICGMVCEQVPVVWSLRSSTGPTLVPHSLIQAAGIAVDSSAATIELVERERRLTAREVIVPQIRFGSVVLRDVKGYALPPEAEDLGARLGREAYLDHPLRIDGRRLRASF